MATPVRVAVEASIENQIQEVTRDGVEVYVQPLSMSEHLTKLAHNIDFYKEETSEKGKPTSEGENEVKDEKQLATFQQNQWPWESVRNKLRLALTEMNVLLDVLQIGKEKKYMVLDPVSQDLPEPKQGIQLLGKKKALGHASEILLKGADHLKKSNAETRGMSSFHQELLSVRHDWRLKKVGNAILGDLSYKSAGSRYWQSSTFEIKKADNLDADPSEVASTNPLEVVIPSELEGVAYIQVAIKKIADTNGDLASAMMKIPTNLESPVSHDATLQHKLESAQNVIFCKELFAQLAKEAVQSKSAVPHIVMGKQIICNLFPGFQLSIALCHYTGKEKKSVGMPQRPDHNHVLEHSLHQLLREAHYKNIHHPMPHPVTGTLGITKKRRLAGPEALERREFVEMSTSETILEQIIAQARHTLLRKRTYQLLDEIARFTPDPLLSCHWNSISTPLESSVKINIISQGYDIVKTRLVLHVGVSKIRAVCKDGQVIILSHEDQELRDLILNQFAQHQVSTLQNLSKMMGWHILSINFHSGVGEMEPLGNASTVMMASPRGDKVLSVRSGPATGMQVSVHCCQDVDEKLITSVKDSNCIIKDPKWLKLQGPFRPVDLSKMEGKNFVAKIELLLASMVSV